MRDHRAIRIILGAVLLSACGAGPASVSGPPLGATSGASAAAGAITIYAAASLKGVLDDARIAYTGARPGTALTISTGSSAALTAQIEQGAPADLLLSADTSKPQRLLDAGLADGSPVPFAANSLTVILPTSDPAGIRTPADLARPGVKVIAAGDAVPITAYASRLVGDLARLPGYPAGYAAAYTANIVSREDDVKAVVAKIELGEGDAAIVYVTDARASTKVRTVTVPEGVNVPASYSGVVVKAAHDPAAAHSFLGWLAGPDGQAILGSFGFLPPR